MTDKKYFQFCIRSGDLLVCRHKYVVRFLSGRKAIWYSYSMQSFRDRKKNERD